MARAWFGRDGANAEQATFVDGFEQGYFNRREQQETPDPSGNIHLHLPLM